MTAALPMGGQKITGMADPTVATDGATKNYVDTTTAAFFSTGDGKITLKNAADPGWILCDDGTFGSATSGSSNRQNADTQALFTLFYNSISDASAPILTSGGGATTRVAQGSAAAAWAANCRMTLTKQLGRAIAISGAGAGLTSRQLGTNLGEENHTLSLSEIPTGITSVVNFVKSVALYLAPVIATFNTGAAVGQPYDSAGPSNISFITTATGTSNNTGGAAHNNMQPTTFWNVMIKL